jgi:hypothetical protein
VEAKVCTRSTYQVGNLEAASKAAFESVNRHFNIMNQQMQRVASGWHNPLMVFRDTMVTMLESEL